MSFPISNTFTANATATYNQFTNTAGTYANQAASALGTDGMDIGGIGGMVGHGLGGGVAAFFQAGKTASAFSGGKAAVSAAAAAKAAETGKNVSLFAKIGTGAKGILGGVKAAFPHLLKGAGLGAAVSGVVSAGVNGYRALVTKEITGRQAAGEIAADTVTGAVTSVGGLALGAAVVGIAGTMLGGIPLAILGTAAGIAGSLLTDRLMQKSGIRNGIRDAIAGTAPTMTPPPAPTPTPTPTPDPTPTPTGGDF